MLQVKKSKGKPFSILIDLELTSLCNADCIFCPHSEVERASNVIDRQLLYKILDNITKLKQKGWNIVVVFAGMGEPLLQKELFLESIDRLISYNVEVELSTNGSLLEFDSFKSIHKLRQTAVSFTGYNENNYKQVNKSGFNKKRFNEVLKNIDNFIKNTSSPIEIVVVKLKYIDIQKTIDFWKNKNVSVSFRDIHSRGGFLKLEEAYKNKGYKRSRCGIFLKILSISCDGLVLSCSHDLKSENIMGDLRTQTIEEIIRYKLHLMEQGQCDFDICKFCTDTTFRPSKML